MGREIDAGDQCLPVPGLRENEVGVLELTGQGKSPDSIEVSVCKTDNDDNQGASLNDGPACWWSRRTRLRAVRGRDRELNLSTVRGKWKGVDGLKSLL